MKKTKRNLKKVNRKELKKIKGGADLGTKLIIAKEIEERKRIRKEEVGTLK
jgi:hypothetical protein